MDYIAIILIILFLLLAIWRLSEPIQYNNRWKNAQRYLDECHKENEEIERNYKKEFMKALKEFEE